MTARTDYTRTVVALFPERRHAEQAIRDLKSAGFSDERIGVAMQNREEQQSLIEDTGSQAAEGAAKGAVSGGIVGGLVGLLGSLLIPGVGPVVVGGVLASALTGAGVGAAAGGIIGALIGLGVPEEDAHHFDRGLRSGGILLTVDAGHRLDDAIGILRSHQADLGPSVTARYEQVDAARAAPAGLMGEEEIILPLTGEQAFSGSPAGGEARIDTEGPAVVRQGAGIRGGYTGRERRRKRNRTYAGPERRLTV